MAHLLNDLRPWWGLSEPYGHALSMVDLVRNGTLSAEEGAAVWWALEHGASLWVVAGPQGAGKTTLATACLTFLPSNARLYVTAGPRDRLELPDGDDGPVYLLVNELSWHLPFYLSGPAARQAFELLREGVRVVGTLHARSTAEALEVMCDEAGVSRSQIAQAAQRTPMLVLVLAARRTMNGIERRVIELGWLTASGAEVEVTRLVPPEFEALTVWVGGVQNQGDKSPAEEIRQRAVRLAAGDTLSLQ
jgi:hypothetical protein